jgi:hypothetical protein
MGVGVFCEPYRAYPSNYKYCVDTALNPTWGLVFGVLGVWCLVFGVFYGSKPTTLPRRWRKAQLVVSFARHGVGRRDTEGCVLRGFTDSSKKCVYYGSKPTTLPRRWRKAQLVVSFVMITCRSFVMIPCRPRALRWSSSTSSSPCSA